MGLTAIGFHRRTYDEILRDKIAHAEELFGSDIDTGEQTPLGKFIRIGAYDQAQAEEEIEDLYYSIFPDTATGISLERLCAFVGISRTPATSSRYQVFLHGPTGTQIPYGFLVETPAKIRFYNTAEILLDENGDGVITVDCETPGVIGNVRPTDITSIVNPLAGLSLHASENVLIHAGLETEDDVQLRKRFAQTRDGAGSCTTNAIRSALLRVPTVTSASVIVNDSAATDASGRPPHCFQCYISGGTDYHEQIAQSIFEKKPIGIQTWGDVEYDIEDEAGNTHTIRFSHTEELKIRVRMSVRTNTAFEGTAGKSEITENIRSYIDGLQIGGEVILSALYGRIHAVAGVVDVASLELSKDNGASWDGANISAEPNQKTVCFDVAISTEGAGTA